MHRTGATGRRGGTTVEYIVIVAAILGVVVLAFTAFRDQATSAIHCLGQKVTGASCGAVTAQNAAASPSNFAVQTKTTSFSCDSLGCHPDATFDGDGEFAAVCFVAGTEVATANGPRPIESIQAGDLVWSRGEESAELRPVVGVKRTPSQPVVALELVSAKGREVLRTTPAHPFFAAGRGFVPAGALDHDDVVETQNGEARVVSLASLAQTENVYNFEVQDLHTYFVGKAHALVHNSCAMPLGDDPPPGDTKPLGPITPKGASPGGVGQPAVADPAANAKVSRLTPGGSWGEIFHQMALPDTAPIFIDGKTPAERLAIIADAKTKLAALGDPAGQKAAAVDAANQMKVPEAKAKALASADNLFDGKIKDIKALKETIWKATHAQLIDDYVRQIGDGERITVQKPDFADVAKKGNSTKDIRLAFEKDPAGTRAAVRARLLGGPASPDQIRAFEGKMGGFAPGDKVAIIWNRNGDYGEGRNTDTKTLERMIEAAKQKGYKVAVMGDPLPADVKSKVESGGGKDMTGLWREAAFKDYGTQIHFLEWIRTKFGGVQIGMKSGAMDGGAFIGLPTTEVVPDRGAVVVSDGTGAKPLMTGGESLVIDPKVLDERTKGLTNEKAKAAAGRTLAREVLKQSGIDPKSFGEVDIKVVEGKPTVVAAKTKGGALEPVKTGEKPLVIDIQELEKAVAGKSDRGAAVREFLAQKVAEAGIDPKLAKDVHLEHQRMMALEGKVPGFSVVDVGELHAKPPPALDAAPGLVEIPKSGVIEPPAKGGNTPAPRVGTGVYVAGAVFPIIGAGVGRIVEREGYHPVAAIVVSTSIGVAPVIYAGGLKAVPGALLPGLAGAGVKYGLKEAGYGATTQDVGGMAAAGTVGAIWGAPFGGPIGSGIGAGVGVIVYSGSEIVSSVVDIRYEGKRGEALNGVAVQNAYWRVFGREADPDGLAGYTNNMNGGWSFIHVRRSLARSDEGTQRITAAYEQLAGRKPTKYELERARWDFGEGADTMQALQARLIVTRIWEVHLGRKPSAQELKDREAELLKGTSIKDFEANIKASREAQTREAAIFALGRPPTRAEADAAKNIDTKDLRGFFAKTPAGQAVVEKMYVDRFGRKPTDDERKTTTDRLANTAVWTLDQELFVRRTYILWLGREPNAGEIAGRVDQFEKGGTAEALDKAVKESPEAQARLLNVQITGKVTPDGAKYAAQIDAISKGKAADVRRDIANGPDAKAIIDKLYGSIFQRAPTADELKAVRDRLGSGETTIWLVEQELVVRKLYFVYLGREPSTDEVKSAIGDLLKGKELSDLEKDLQTGKKK